MTLDEFNNKYSYMKDIDQWGIDDLWEVINPNKDGNYFGDCESYCLTLIANVEGFKNLELWYCEYVYPDKTSLAHCVGRIPNTNMWIDCNYKRLVTEKFLKDSQGWQTYRKFSKFELWRGTTYAKIYKKIYNSGNFGEKIAIGITNFLK